MKKHIAIILLLFSLPASAVRLQTIDMNDWIVAYSNVAPKIIVDCDCTITTNPGGTVNRNEPAAIRYSRNVRISRGNNG